MEKLINKIIADIEQNKLPRLTMPSDQIAVFHLSVIKSILKQSVFEEAFVDIAKIHEALHYIETIKIEKKSFFFNTPGTMAELFAQKKETVLPEEERKQLPYTFPEHDRRQAIAIKNFEDLGTIHKTLCDAFQNYLKFRAATPRLSSAWTFSYPTDENGEVMNQSIGTWQGMIMRPNDDPKKAYDDFTRDISIRCMTGKTEKDAENLIKYLVDGANYTVKESEAVTKWLMSNGGQSNNRFIDMLIMSGVFTNNIEASNLSAKSIEHNWTLENGKIVFNCDMVSYALLIDGEACVNNKDMRLISTDVDKLGSTPLLRFQAKIELRLDKEQNVKPCVVSLNTTSFTRDLTSPAKLHPEQDRAPKLT